MSRGLKKYAAIVLLICIVAAASLPPATAEFEIRKEVKAGDLLFNDDITAIAILRLIFHQEKLANTDTETFAMSPLSTATDNGLTMAQASALSTAASHTGLITTLRYSWVPYDIGDKIGDSPYWAANVEPINFAGIPPNSMMIFPQMTMIKRMPNNMGNDFDHIIDANSSLPMYPGNMMLVKNVTDEHGRNTTAFERLPRDYWTPNASSQEIANKTILKRMWANAHIVYIMDKAYIGETCSPTLICPYKNISTFMPLVPDDVAINGALNMTRQGMHMRKIFWPVA